MKIPKSTIEREVVVIGAGLAGSIAARQLALLGHNVLMVEANTFPRWKVCGCCLGQQGGQALDDIGLGGMLDSIGAKKIMSTSVYWRGRKRSLQNQWMRGISRAALDNALVYEAEKSGADIVFNTRARIESTGYENHCAVVSLRSKGMTSTVLTHAVVLAAGLRSSHTDILVKGHTSRRSHIGLGLIGTHRPSWLNTGELSMFLGDEGYVGCVLTEKDQVTWGAAVAPGAIRSAGSPGKCIARILLQAGVDSESLEGASWLGTPRLTQSHEAQTGRVYRVGDAAGYVEPITGEGMSWAILSGAHSAVVIHRALRKEVSHESGAWTSQSRRLLRGSKRRCGFVARAVRTPAVLYPAFALAGVSTPLGTIALSKAIGGKGRKESTA